MFLLFFMFYAFILKPAPRRNGPPKNMVPVRNTYSVTLTFFTSYYLCLLATPFHLHAHDETELSLLTHLFLTLWSQKAVIQRNGLQKDAVIVRNSDAIHSLVGVKFVLPIHLLLHELNFDPSLCLFFRIITPVFLLAVD